MPLILERESGLNRDAGETIERLEWEAQELAKASDGHEARLDAASEEARLAASVLQDRETDLATRTEDVARLAARHQSAQRLLDDSQKTLSRSETEADRARQAVDQSELALNTALAEFETAGAKEKAADRSRDSG